MRIQVTAFDTATYPSQNYNFGAWNVSGKVQNIGCSAIPGAQLFDGYMKQLEWHWSLLKSPYTKGMLALAAHRSGRKELANIEKAILAKAAEAEQAAAAAA